MAHSDPACLPPLAHIFEKSARPGDTCVCGATTWMPPRPTTAKATGPVPVDEALEK